MDKLFTEINSGLTHSGFSQKLAERQERALRIDSIGTSPGIEHGFLETHFPSFFIK